MCCKNFSAAVLTLLLMSVLTASGCATANGPSFGPLGVPLPVSPFTQDELEMQYRNKERYGRVPVLGPLTAGGPTTALDPPSQEEIMAALEKARPIRGNYPFLYEIQRNNVRIVTEPLSDYIDPPRVYPRGINVVAERLGNDPHVVPLNLVKKRIVPPDGPSFFQSCHDLFLRRRIQRRGWTSGRQRSQDRHPAIPLLVPILHLEFILGKRAHRERNSQGSEARPVGGSAPARREHGHQQESQDGSREVLAAHESCTSTDRSAGRFVVHRRAKLLIVSKCAELAGFSASSGYSRSTIRTGEEKGKWERGKLGKKSKQEKERPPRGCMRGGLDTVLGHYRNGRNSPDNGPLRAPSSKSRFHQPSCHSRLTFRQPSGTWG